MLADKYDAIFTVFAPLNTRFGVNDHMRALKLSLLFCVNPPMHHCRNFRRLDLRR